ncbi:MAG TPA: alpha/beta hydrolase [Planctomycetota bacterium]|nr:alpha/beta hydrolase [Planctomycetota bacterium]
MATHHLICPLSNPGRILLRVVCYLFLSLLFASISLAETTTPDPATPSDLTLGITYGTGSGKPLLLDLAQSPSPAKQPRPAVVFIHGGAWSGADRTNGHPLIRLLAANGFVAVSIDYRLSGQAAFPAQLEDCKCAVRFLRAHAQQYHLDPKRIGVAGGSAGGHLAALVGLTPRTAGLEGNGGWDDISSQVAAVADLYGISDMAALFDEKTLVDAAKKLMRTTPQENPERYRQASPLALVNASAPPFYLAHGDRDTTVPFSHSQKLADALKAQRVEASLRVMTGQGHESIATLPNYVKDDLVAFFTKQLGPVEAPHR